MTDQVQKIREKVEKQLNLLERVAEKLKNGLITSGNVSHTSKVQGYTIENVVNNIKEILQKEPVSEDLEEACEQLAENTRKYKAETSSPFFSQGDYKQGVIDGAKWQKEKQIKDAVEWNINKPQGNTIVAKIAEDFCYKKDYYEVLRFASMPYPHYYDARCEEVPYSAIEKWALIK